MQYTILLGGPPHAICDITGSACLTQYAIYDITGSARLTPYAIYNITGGAHHICNIQYYWGGPPHAICDITGSAHLTGHAIHGSSDQNTISIFFQRQIYDTYIHGDESGRYDNISTERN
jgi:hypothetical protein